MEYQIKLFKPNRVQYSCHLLLQAALLLLPLWLTGCFGGGLQTTVEPQTDSALVIHRVYAVVTYITAAIFVLVTALLAWAIFRFRAVPGKESDIPKQVHGSSVLEITWMVIPAVILVFIAVPTWSAIFRAAAPPRENALIIRAVGHQWWWEFQYPQNDIVTANELYLPLNRTVVVETTSADVIHSFWVPQLQGKKDSLPGRTNSLWFTTEKAGSFYGQCAEYCGSSHALMRFVVHVVPEQEYEQWAAQQQLPPVPAHVDAKVGEQLFVSKTCVACHKISGNPVAVGNLGPNLTNLPARKYLSGGVLENTRENLATWIHHPQVIKPRVLMGVAKQDERGHIYYERIDMTFVEADQLAAYLLSLPGGDAAMKNAASLISSRQAAGEAVTATTASGDGDVNSLIQKGICWTCHVIPGVSNAVGVIGPSLAGYGSKAKIIELLDLNAANLKRWLKNPQEIKPGTAMPAAAALSDTELDVVVEYLLSL